MTFPTGVVKNSVIAEDSIVGVGMVGRTEAVPDRLELGVEGISAEVDGQLAAVMGEIVVLDFRVEDISTPEVEG